MLKLTELDIDSCWLTFTDSARIKAALGLTTPLEVAAIVAFGYGEKTQKKLRLNILNMSTSSGSTLHRKRVSGNWSM